MKNLLVWFGFEEKDHRKSFKNLIDHNDNFNRYYNSSNYQFKIENELNLLKNVLEDSKTRYKDICISYHTTSIHHFPLSSTCSIEIESSNKSNKLCKEYFNDSEHNWEEISNLSLLEAHNSILEHIAIREDNPLENEAFNQSNELLYLISEIEKNEKTFKRLNNLRTKILSLKRKFHVDIRFVFRRIFQFMFKNLDDAHDVFINYRINKNYLTLSNLIS